MSVTATMPLLRERVRAAAVMLLGSLIMSMPHPPHLKRIRYASAPRSCRWLVGDSCCSAISQVNRAACVIKWMQILKPHTLCADALRVRGAGGGGRRGLLPSVGERQH